MSETKHPNDKDKKSTEKPKSVDRPGFDLGGASGKNVAGSGLGLPKDAVEDRKARRLPR